MLSPYNILTALLSTALVAIDAATHKPSPIGGASTLSKLMTVIQLHFTVIDACNVGNKTCTDTQHRQ